VSRVSTVARRLCRLPGDASAGFALCSRRSESITNMSNITLPITDLYAPVQPHLDDVVRIMDAELSSELPMVNELCEHVRGFRGKMLRPALVLLTADALGSVTEDHRVIAAVVEMVHLATLVHDDVLDEALIRRQQPTINQLRGNEAAVMLGDCLISHAFHLCASLESQHASRRIGATTNTVCEGELLQLHHRGNRALDENTYLKIIRRKTAALTAVSGELGAHFARADQAIVSAMARFGDEAGVAFQIMDDVLDLVGSETDMGKTLGRDMELAKLTLPIIHALSTDPKQIGPMLDDPSVDRAELAAALRRAGGIEYAIDTAQRHTRSAIEQLRTLPDSPARNSLEAMTEFIITRSR